jgi:hypothetical protein
MTKEPAGGNISVKFYRCGFDSFEKIEVEGFRLGASGQ